MKDKYIKPLRLANKLFYWIPEMINYPLQKYVADPSMARSNTQKKKRKVRVVFIYPWTFWFLFVLVLVILLQNLNCTLKKIISFVR